MEIREAMERCRNRDESGLRELWTRYRDSVFRLALRTGLTKEDAEELCGDVFFQLWCKAHTIDLSGHTTEEEAERHVRHWVFRVASWKIAGVLKGIKSAPVSVSIAQGDPDDLTAGNVVLTASEGPDERFEEESRKLAHETMLSFIRLLNPLDRLIILLHAEGLSYREILAVLTIQATEELIRQRFCRSRLRVQRWLVVCTLDDYLRGRKEGRCVDVRSYLQIYVFEPVPSVVLEALGQEEQCRKTLWERWCPDHGRQQNVAREFVRKHFCEGKTYRQLVDNAGMAVAKRLDAAVRAWLRSHETARTICAEVTKGGEDGSPQC
ncbi:MAG: sigma-70 family RNA polymerase sigma factor [Candidatus Hadarchaeum sp.]